MRSWSILAVLLLAASGCLDSSEPEPTPSDDPIADPVTPARPVLPVLTDDGLDSFSFNATGCNAMVSLHIDDYGAMDDFLPAGFIPADVMSLLKLQDNVFIGQGAYGAIIAECAASDITNGSFSVVMPGTLVDAPLLETNMPPSWVDAYEDFIMVSDPDVAELFETYGWDVEPNVTASVIVGRDVDVHDEVNSQVPGLGVALGSIVQNETTIFNTFVTGGPTFHTSGSEAKGIRFWFDTPDGLSLFEVELSEHGKSGPVVCQYMAPSRMDDTFGARTVCEPGGSIGLVIADFDFRATMTLLEGVHA